jgi:hypothetical protein
MLHVQFESCSQVLIQVQYYLNIQQEQQTYFSYCYLSVTSLIFSYFFAGKEFTCTSHSFVSVASGLGITLGQFKDNTLEIMKIYKLFKQSVLEVSFSLDSTAKAIPVQAYYRPRGFQEVEAPRFRDS